MMFSAQTAGVLATKVVANSTLVPVDPAFVPESSGVVLHGGVALTNGSYRRTSSVMLIEIPNGANLRIRVTSSEDATVKASLLSRVVEPISSGTVTAYARNTNGTGYAGVNFVPFSAPSSLVQVPISFKMGVGDATAGLAFVSPVVSTIRRSASQAPTTIAAWYTDADESVWNVPPVGRFLGALMSQGLLHNVLSDVQFKVANLSAMADRGTYVYARCRVPASTEVLAFNGMYVGDAVAKSGNYYSLVNIGGIVRYRVDPAFISMEPAPGSVLLVVSGTASTDMITIQKGI